MTIHTRRFMAGAAVLAGAAGLLAAPAAADDTADFFKGKQMNAISGGGAGGGFALAARILGRHMVNHIPGNPDWIVTAMPGAGGARSIKYIVNAAAQDGTVIGAVLPPAVLSPLLRPGVGYKSEDLQWIGSISPMPSVLSVWHTHNVNSLDDAKKREVIVATSSKLSTNYFMSMFLNKVAGTKFKVISGYQGGDRQNNAMEKGEVHARASFFNSYKSTKADWLRDRKIIHLATLGPRLDELKDATHLADVAKTPEQRKMVAFMQAGENVGHGFFVSPGVPKARVDALRKAFDATMKDAAFLDDAKKRNVTIEPVAGVELDKSIDEAMDVPQSLVDDFKKLVEMDAPKKKQ